MLIAFIGTSEEKTLRAFRALVETNPAEFKIVSHHSAILNDNTSMNVISLENYKEFLNTQYDQIILSEPINDNEEYLNMVTAFRTQLTGNIVNGMEEQVCD